MGYGGQVGRGAALTILLVSFGIFAGRLLCFLGSARVSRAGERVLAIAHLMSNLPLPAGMNFQPPAALSSAR